MLEFISVTLVSAAGWLFSLSFPRSAARRHAILISALGACLLLPMALFVRSGTSWTLLTFKTKVRGNTIAPTGTPPTASAIERASLIDNTSASEAAALAPHALGVTEKNDIETFGSSPAIPDLSATSIARPEQLAPQNPTAVPRSSWQTSAAQWGRTVYAVVAATLLIRLLFGLASVLRLKRFADPIDSIAGGIPVLEANIAIPLAIGFGKPVIVLPRRIRCDSHTERAARRPSPRSRTLAATRPLDHVVATADRNGLLAGADGPSAQPCPRSRSRRALR